MSHPVQPPRGGDSRRQLLAGGDSRRQVLAAMAAAAGAALLARPALAAGSPVDALRRKRLIVLTLFGGNDGLNTLVPYRDPLYRQLRPTLALRREDVLPLDDELALHPALGTLAAMYQAGELAVLPDVGYPEPDLSHFSSIAVWNTGDAKPAAGTGWWAKVVAANRSAFADARLDAAAVSFEPTAAFAAGSGTPVLHAHQNVADLFASQRPPDPAAAARPGAAGELAALLQEAAEVRTRVAARLAQAQRPVWRPSEDAFHVQARLAHWFIAQGVQAPLLRLEMGGFDTHTALLPRHGQLMRTLDRELGELRGRLLADGLWRDTVILVHSEFGRRPAENGFAGTDHGTAGPVLVLGGGVQGGMCGRRADLGRLDAAGNPQALIDFRQVYATLVTQLFGLSAAPLTAEEPVRAAFRLA